jgi:4-hydroxy-tetrahydrodipicolinate synthase
VLYSGDDAVTLPTLSVSGYGIISVASHLIGAKMKDLISAYLEGRIKDAIAINSECYPIFNGLFNCPHPVPNPAAVKYALSMRGVQVGGVRLPLVPVNDSEAQFLHQLLEE